MPATDFKVQSLTAKKQNVLDTRTRACNTRTRSQPPVLLLVLEDSQGKYSKVDYLTPSLENIGGEQKKERSSLFVMRLLFFPRPKASACLAY